MVSVVEAAIEGYGDRPEMAMMLIPTLWFNV